MKHVQFYFHFPFFVLDHALEQPTLAQLNEEFQLVLKPHF